jgi:hypothetical protein
MTKAEVQSLIDTNLASGTTITAAEHRAVETEILNFAEKAGAVFAGTLNIGNVPTGGSSYPVSFPYSLPDANYVVMGTLVSLSANPSNDFSVDFIIKNKNANGFSVVAVESGNITQNVQLDYVVFKK